ncbi:RNA polymerase sigma factor [Gemmatimonas groenlandica]|uniref:RNA polymerase sigma factor n=1 Tax=Gemmatimonas groenlandica TaxID=2732249 RepID=UPI00197E3EF7|nr:RNA polymerase sigma factor [Gemmatimonas groenlandica]
MTTPVFASLQPAVPASSPGAVAAVTEAGIVVSAGSGLDTGLETDVAAAATGDRRAFERLYRAHVDRVYAICTRMLADQQLAEEVTQDVFVRVWQKLPGFRGESAFSTWLHRVAVNVVLSRRKRASIHGARTADDDALDEAPSRAVFVGERLDLDAAIAGLPAGARRVFVLHDVEGFTHEEIGEQLGITPGGSKAQLHRARMLLRAALNR